MRSIRFLGVLSLVSALTGSGCGGATPRGGNGGFTPLDGGGGGQGDMSFTFGIDGPPKMVCQPGDPPTCASDSTISICNADGTGFDMVDCPMGTVCGNGVCNCKPGDTQCSGSDVLICGMDGMFKVDHTCPNGLVCNHGLCDEVRCHEETISNNPHALPVDGWPRFRHDNRNSGATPVAVADKPVLKWKLFIGGATLNGPLGGLGAGPVIGQTDLIYIGGGDLSMGGSLMAIDPTGMMPKVLYTFPAMRGFGSSTPAVRNDGTAYFASQNAKLYAVDPMGKQTWSYATGSQADGDPIVTKDGNLVYSSDDGSLYSLDGNGMLLWKSDRNTGPGEVDGGLAESCDGRIYAAGANGWFALDAKTGKTLWSVPATGGFHAILSSPLVTADGRMFGFDGGGQGVALDPAGKVLWQKQLGPAGAGCSLGMAAGVLYAMLNDGAIHAIDATTGMEKWKQPVGNKAREIGVGPITDGKQRIYINSSDGNVYAFDATGKLLWKLPHSGKDSSSNSDIQGTMAIDRHGTLYVPGNDGYLYAYQ